MNRELLEEAAEILRRGQPDEMKALAGRIDAALSEPEPDAEALATAIIEAQHASNTYRDWVLNAAILIESHSKRVPRAMLRQLEHEVFVYLENDNAMPFPDAMADDVAAKYGYRAE